MSSRVFNPAVKRRVSKRTAEEDRAFRERADRERDLNRQRIDGEVFIADLNDSAAVARMPEGSPFLFQRDGVSYGGTLVYGHIDHRGLSGRGVSLIDEGPWSGPEQDYRIWTKGLPTFLLRSDRKQTDKEVEEEILASFQPNPTPGRAAVRMYEAFQGHEPRKIGPFSSSFHIPTRVQLAGEAVNVLYRSDKNDPGTLKVNKKPIDYIHDHDAGVKVYRTDASFHGPAKDVPNFIRDVQELVLLGTCLGFAYLDDEGFQVEAEPTQPHPELYTIPSGRALLVIQGKSRVLAIIWGGRLGVEARGIVH